jgi:hypothetical protein
MLDPMLESVNNSNILHDGYELNIDIKRNNVSNTNKSSIIKDKSSIFDNDGKSILLDMKVSDTLMDA